MKLLITFVCIVCLLNGLNARVGENHQTLLDRFGEPTEYDKGSYMAIWAMKGFSYAVTFSNDGKSISEIIMANGFENLTDPQRENFMSANGDGWHQIDCSIMAPGVWNGRQIPYSFDKVHWTNSDESLLGIQKTGIAESFIITSLEGIKIQAERTLKKEEKEAVEF